MVHFSIICLTLASSEISTLKENCEKFETDVADLTEKLEKFQSETAEQEAKLVANEKNIAELTKILNETLLLKSNLESTIEKVIFINQCMYLLQVIPL